MLSQRVVTSLAIAFGGVLGSLAALVRGEPIAAEPPPAPPELPVKRDRTPPASPPGEPAVSAAGAELSPAPAALEGLEAIQTAELACARGDGRACLDAAEAHEHGRGVTADPERARMLTGLGVQQFAVRCMDRVPAACLELAKLHKAGRGVAKDTVAADALVDRATMICSNRPSAPGCPGAQP